MNQEALVRIAKEIVGAIVSDDSTSAEEIQESLEELRDDIDSRIKAVVLDIDDAEEAEVRDHEAQDHHERSCM